MCTFGDPCKRGASTVNSPLALLLFPPPLCSLLQVGFRCYANLPSGHRLRRGRPRPLHLIPWPPLLLCSSLLNLQTIFSSPLFNLFFFHPHASPLHMSSPLNPHLLLTLLFFSFRVSRSSSTCFYSCRSPLTWPFTGLHRSFKKIKKCVLVRVPPCVLLQGESM